MNKTNLDIENLALALIDYCGGEVPDHGEKTAEVLKDFFLSRSILDSYVSNKIIQTAYLLQNDCNHI